MQHSRSSQSFGSININSKPSSPTVAFRTYLLSLNLPNGLLASVLHSYNKCDSRLWLLDNSSSMRIRDSHIVRSVSNGTIERLDNVSRWEELQECVAYHAKMASRCWIPTKYWLVNEEGLHKFKLCWGAKEDVSSELNQIRHVMKEIKLDQSQCPLAARLRSLAKGIAKLAPALRAQKRHLTLVICTQGLTTDIHGATSSNVRLEFQHALAAFGKLPVKVIVRLCTDDERAREWFNIMDGRFDGIDVLDDFWGEAMEVYLHNPWLTYGLGLHRLREAGLAPEIIDDLDERPLTLDEIYEFCKLLFVGDDGESIQLPHPKKSWNNFFGALTVLVEKERPQWNPVRRALMPWINLIKLQSKYGHHGRTDPSRGRQCTDPTSSQRHSSRGALHSSMQTPRSRGEPRGGLHSSMQAPRSRGEPRGGVHSSFQAPRSRGDLRGGLHSSFQAPRPHADLHSSFQGQRSRGDQQSSSNQSRDAPQQQRRRHTIAEPAAAGKDLTLEDTLKRWSHQPSDFKVSYPLGHLLATVPETFPPTNTKVEPHAYFSKWKEIDKEAFADESGDELKELLKRATRKAKFFLHPDKLPKDLTENQTLLLKTIWDVLQDQEEAFLG